MSDYTIKEFIKKFNPCQEGVKWALAECSTMQEVFAKAKPEWRIWIATRPGIMSKKDLILWVCKCIKKIPLHNGGTVWDLLTDKRSKKAIKIAKKYAKGKVTIEEVEDARVAADAADAAVSHAARAAAARAVSHAARAAAVNAARAAAVNAVHAAADAAAYAADADADADAAADAAQKFQSDLLNKYELNFSKKK